jgi:hypothetical protein
VAADATFDEWLAVYTQMLAQVAEAYPNLRCHAVKFRGQFAWFRADWGLPYDVGGCRAGSSPELRWGWTEVRMCACCLQVYWNATARCDISRSDQLERHHVRVLLSTDL